MQAAAITIKVWIDIGAGAWRGLFTGRIRFILVIVYLFLTPPRVDTKQPVIRIAFALFGAENANVVNFRFIHFMLIRFSHTVDRGIDAAT
jgi:hypothetical protein